MRASISGCVTVVELLLAAKADFNLRDEGSSFTLPHNLQSQRV
jgi:hypothetical protein